MNKQILLFVLILLAVGSVSSDATPKRYTLRECIDRSRSDGPSAQMARQLFRSRTFMYRSFNGGLLPQILLTGTAPDYERAINPIVQNDGTTAYLAQSQANSSLSLSLTEPLVLTGGSIFVSSSLSRTDLFGTENSTYWRSSPIVVGFRQPLFQLNTLWWDNRANDLQYEQAQKKYNEDMEDAMIDVTQKFFDVYVAQMRVDNAELNVSINDTLLTISRGRFEVGKIDENDLLQSELALANAKTQRASAQLDMKIALRSLATSLGTSDDDIDGIVPAEELPEVRVALETAMAEAHNNRSDLLGYSLQEHNAERNLRQQQLATGFNATITASYGYNQTGSQVGDVYKNPLNQQSARLDLTVPLWQWGKGSNAVAAAEEELDRTRTSLELQRKSFDQDVEAQVERFVQNQEQLRLSLKADTIAQKQYILAKNRYLIGKYDVTKLLLAQDAKDKARESLILTEQSYWLSYFRLRRATLYDFESDKKIAYPAP